tara:strand:- start:18 stop:428 length:411 start_codon:yes stop_codon:yes gene_type:complete
MLNKLLKSKYLKPTMVVVATVLTIAIAYKCKDIVFRKETFRGNLKNGEKAFVLVHMTGCGHCDKLMPIWDEANKNNTSNIKMHKVEQSENMGKELCEKHDIKSFPTMIVVDDNNEKVSEYQGERDKDSLLNYLHGL